MHQSSKAHAHHSSKSNQNLKHEISSEYVINFFCGTSIIVTITYPKIKRSACKFWRQLRCLVLLLLDLQPLFSRRIALWLSWYRGILMTISLCFEERIGPKNDWHKVVGGNEFGLSRTLSVDLLFGGCIDRHAFTKRHVATWMTTHFRMHSMRTINPPFGDGKNRVSAQDQRKLNRSAQILNHAS